MPLQKLQFRPGVNRETTSYSNEGGWFDMDKVRFRYGFPEKIGGWVKQSTNTFLGTCRALHPWSALDGSQFLGVGTNLKYYVNEGGGYNDITPVRATTSAGDLTFVAVATTLSSSITDADTSIPLTSVTNFPPSGRIKINDEIITYSSINGNNLTTVLRGQNGTTAAAHTSGDNVLCSTITVTDNDHDAIVGDFLTISGATSLGGNVTADVLNQEYEITEILDDNSYTIDVREVSAIPSITTSSGLNPTYVFANSSDSGNGGSSSVGAYQISIGLDTSVAGNGWGAGTYSRGSWDSSTTLQAEGATLRIWSHDNFGQNLIMNVRDGGVFYWDRTTGLAARAVPLSSLTGANKTPTIAKQVLVSDRDRHVVAFGCDPESSPGVQDPLLIRFSDQENPAEWEATVENTAGDLRIGSGSQIMAAIETRQQILVFTDVSLHAMQYLGEPFTFGINEISTNLTVAGPLSVVAVEDNVFWMGLSEFYTYGGAVQKLPCTVRDYVFSDINEAQREKVTASTNTAFSEVIWFYPSKNSNENDRYVVYNYQQQIWYYGTLSRTVWLDRGVNDDPLAASTDHYLYFHEVGFDDGSQVPAAAINSYIESSQMDLGEGEQFVFMKRVIPDITFRDSTADTPTATMTLKVRNFPGENYASSSANAVTKTASVPIEQFTDQIFVRLRGRSFALRVESSNAGVGWRLGSPRVDIRPDGRR